MLTVSNILLTVRLLHTECSHGISSQLPAPPQPPHQQPLQALPLTPAPPPVPCIDIYDQRLLNQTEDNVFGDVNLSLGRWDSTRSYKMFDYAVEGEQYATLSDQFKVCLATQSSLERLSSMAQVAHRWTGPISAAVYAAGEELAILKAYIGYLRRCYPVVKSRVSFHLTVPSAKPAQFSFATTSTPDPTVFDCTKPEATLNRLLKFRLPETAKWRLKHPYPQNHLRNLARRNCQSSYVFLTDVDIIPSGGLTESLDAFLRHSKCRGLCAYVVPTYELDERVRFPSNKTDLIRLANKGLARPFHHKVFIYNQFATNFSR